MVEFAVVSILLLTVVFGIMDFGYMFAGREAMFQATRTAARFAATNPTAWTNVANPDTTTIEGNLIVTAVPAQIPNDDAHITISYQIPRSGSATTCGAWKASANAFVPRTGYTQQTCVVQGNLISVKATYVYKFITPMLSTSFRTMTITSTAVVMEEV